MQYNINIHHGAGASKRRFSRNLRQPDLRSWGQGVAYFDRSSPTHAPRWILDGIVSRWCAGWRVETGGAGAWLRPQI